jgi:hypothetical protein
MGESGLAVVKTARSVDSMSPRGQKVSLDPRSPLLLLPGSRRRRAERAQIVILASFYPLPSRLRPGSVQVDG